MTANVFSTRRLFLSSTPVRLCWYYGIVIHRCFQIRGSRKPPSTLLQLLSVMLIVRKIFMSCRWVGDHYCSIPPFHPNPLRACRSWSTCQILIDGLPWSLHKTHSHHPCLPHTPSKISATSVWGEVGIVFKRVYWWFGRQGLPDGIYGFMRPFL